MIAVLPLPSTLFFLQSTSYQFGQLVGKDALSPLGQVVAISSKQTSTSEKNDLRPKVCLVQRTIIYQKGINS